MEFIELSSTVIPLIVSDLIAITEIQIFLNARNISICIIGPFWAKAISVNSPKDTFVLIHHYGSSKICRKPLPLLKSRFAERLSKFVILSSVCRSHSMMGMVRKIRIIPRGPSLIVIQGSIIIRYATVWQEVTVLTDWLMEWHLRNVHAKRRTNNDLYVVRTNSCTKLAELNSKDCKGSAARLPQLFPGSPYHQPNKKNFSQQTGRLLRSSVICA